jgi:chitodextrinase
MRRPTLFCWLLLVAALVPTIALAGGPRRPTAQAETISIRPRILRAAHGTRISRIAAPARPRPADGQPAVINVTYNGFPSDAKLAFQRAVDIWSGLISSPVPIRVVATWEALPAGVLGAAGPSDYRHDFQHAPLSNTWYPMALANTLAGTDLNGATEEIDASFNSDFTNWYFGTDGQTPLDKYDLVSVVLHELGHGLGFVDSMSYSSGSGSWGGGTGRPVVFDRFIVNGAGQQLVDTGSFPNPSAALGSQLVSSNLFFSGPKATAVGGSRPRLYAPNPFEAGSSIAHLDLDTYPIGNANSLMTPALSNGVSIHDPGPISLGIFQDVGWSLPTPSDTPIAGLTASNDGPTTIGSPTTLTAAVGTGTNVSYSWDFGDDTSSSGASAQHTYAATGQYQAVVTATNQSGSATASTAVTVSDVAVSGLQASSNGPTNLGNPTTFAATVATGTNVSYSWDFGDGTSGSGATVAHTYQAQGTYSASVTASNSAGSLSFPVSAQVLPSSVSATITPNQGTLATQDNTFQAFFPTGAVTQVVDITYTARLTPSQPLSDSLVMLRGFALEARTSDGQPFTRFLKPYTITLGYTDAEAAAREIDEQGLRVVYWSGGWADVLPCAECSVDTSANRITLALDYVGEFAVIGKQRSKVLLPIVARMT